MARLNDLALTALAPVIWGSSYIVITQVLPQGRPIGLSMLRALPAGLLLILLLRSAPPRRGWGRLLVLGGLNFTVFWSLLFLAAERLPGGVAATAGAVQPLMVLALAGLWLGSRLTARAIIAACGGLMGVALLVLTAEAELDAAGLVAALGGALAMACGTVLTRRWALPVPPLTLAAWQLTAGGLLLLPLALWLEPGLPVLDAAGWAGIAWLGLIGAAATYALWFRGLERLGPAHATLLGFLSPVSATLLGWSLLDETLTAPQLAGMFLILGAIALSRPTAPAPPATLAAPVTR